MIATKFRLDMTTDTDEFSGSETDRILAVAAILRELADRLEGDATTIGPLRDCQGHLIGQYEFYSEKVAADISLNT